VVVFLDDVGAVAAGVVFRAADGGAADGGAADGGAADGGAADGGALDDLAGALFGAAVEQPATVRSTAIETEETSGPAREGAFRSALL
jgi:hypothetical protein